MNFDVAWNYFLLVHHCTLIRLNISYQTCSLCFCGPFICGSHIATSKYIFQDSVFHDYLKLISFLWFSGWLWYMLALFNTLNAHSGYHFPLFPSPESHDFHHLKFNQCYGVLGILDYLHGTDTLFRSNKAYQRHVMLLSSTPVRETFPDENVKKLD